MKATLSISSRRLALVAGAVLVLALVVALIATGLVLHSVSTGRSEARAESKDLAVRLERADAKSADLDKQLALAKTQLQQLTGDSQGKNAVIKTLQDDTVAKQAAIDSLTSQKASLKSCLDGVTLALVQLTNNGSAEAKSTIDGVRDVCKQAEVLL